LICDYPIAAVGLVFLLIGLFKLMNQFEAARRAGQETAGSLSGRSK
jgi:hypothetical protein